MEVISLNTKYSCRTLEKDALYLQPIRPSVSSGNVSPEMVLVIHRRDASLSLQERVKYSGLGQVKMIYGILGMIQLLSGT